MAKKCRVHDLGRHYSTFKAVDGVSLDIEEGEFVVLLGPSGCGKTTTLRMIAGLETPTEGTVEIDGRTMYSAAQGVFVRPEHRDIGMVFQSYAIWPHMTVFENVAYPLRARRTPSAEVRGKVERVLDLVGLSGAAQRSAVALSGGQMQRVALARALVYDPAILLFDEPLSNLDLKLRERLRIELKALQRSTGLTSIYVTHDQSEAVELADRIVVMDKGKVVQVGPPHELYRSPRTRFVAEFISTANIFNGEVAAVKDSDTATIRTPEGRVLVTSRAENLTVGMGVGVVVHPEDCSLYPKGAGGPAAHQIEVEKAQFQGTSTRYQLKWGSDPFHVVELGTTARFSEGQTIDVVIEPQSVCIMQA